MTPFEFFQWSIAAAGAIILVGFALAIAIVFVKGALTSTRRPK
jgi:hypothetical protein